jgi:hypothetical protein
MLNGTLIIDEMSLLQWLGKDEPVELPKPKPRVRSKTRTRVKATSTDCPVVLGVIGTRSSMNMDDFELNVIQPTIEVWGRPTELLLPSEGESSHVALQWAQKNGVSVRMYSCDWAKKGRTASTLRNASIQKEASHLILLQGPRSNALMTLARRLHGRSRPVVISERPGEVVKSVCSM